MTEFPNFLSYGYQIIAELGRNREGGRITWKVKKVDSPTILVLKQFCFAMAGSSWSGFQAYEREIEVLQELNHPGIPRYLGSFATPDGFCLIQEYKDAPSLNKKRSFSPEEIKIIAIKILKILIYLQSRIPPIFHRDLKPENILVDRELNVYLVDFGLAKIGSEKVSGSSIFKGTPGFISPEQLIRPTLASDLYGLGATLICLITGINSSEIQELISKDDPYRLEFKHLLPQLSLRFINWLENMVAPKLTERFPNSTVALERLQPLDLIRTPEVKISQDSLELKAFQLGEKIKTNLTINNPIPETQLIGKWSVMPHPSDPPHSPGRHAWITFKPKKITNNFTQCQVIVDTNKLISDQLYQRKIVLETNGIPAHYILPLKVYTAPLKIEHKKTLNFGMIGALVLLMPSLVAGLGAMAIAKLVLAANSMIWGVIGGVAVLWGVVIAWAGAAAITLTLADATIGVSGVYLIVALTIVAAVFGAGAIAGIFAGCGAGLVASLGAISVIKFLISNFKERGFHQGITITSLLLTIALGITSGITLLLGLVKPILLIILATGLPLVGILLYPHYHRSRLIARYRDAENKSLIKP